MRNYFWNGFKTKREAEAFQSTVGSESQIFNIKKEKDRLENQGYSDCLAVYQQIDESIKWVVEWCARM